MCGALTAGAVCPDLDGNSVADCTETLVMNPGFDTNVTSWTAEGGVKISWDGASDAEGKSTSGALMIKNVTTAAQDGWFLAGAVQCVPVTGGAAYDFAAQLSVQANPGGCSGILSVTYFQSADCSGDVAGAILSQQATTTDTCEVLQLHPTIPAGTASASIRLGTIKPFRQTAALVVDFDNVLFKKH
jgi:hypothetical protein